MYISKYILNDSNSFVKACLSDVDKMHKFVWSFFEDTSDFCVSREGLGILYRSNERKVEKVIYCEF